MARSAEPTSGPNMYTRANLEALVASSPHGPVGVLQTLSVVNDFMFRPPPPTYGFGLTGDRSASAKRISSKVGDASKASLVCIPWSHTHPSDGKPMGVSPLGRSGTAIPCLYLQHADSPYLMLFFHGNACDIGFPSSHLLSLYSVKLRTSILCMDYPGYGVHPGEPSELGIKLAAERVLQFLLSTCDASFSLSRLIIMGQSIGTGVALHCVDRLTQVFGFPSGPVPIRVQEDGIEVPQSNCLAGVILKAPFTSVKNIVTMNKEHQALLKDVYATMAQEGSSQDPAEGGGSGDVRLKTPDAPLKPPTDGIDGTREPERATVAPVVTPPSSDAGEDKTLMADQRDVSVDVDDDEGVEDLPLLYRFGVHLIRDRFRSIDVIRRCREHGMFAHVPLLMIHGTRDDVIHFDHSVILASTARTAAKTERVSLKLIEGAGHNDILAQQEMTGFFIAELPLVRVKPGVMPAATALVLPEAQLMPTLTAQEAFEAHASFILRTRRFLHFLALVVFCAQLVITGVVHGVECADSFEWRLILIATLEFIGGCGVAAASYSSYRYGLHGTRGPTVAYLVARALAYLTVGVAGYVMAPVALFSSMVDWNKMRRDSPKDEWACVDAPRAALYVVWCLHLAHLLWSVLRNK